MIKRFMSILLCVCMLASAFPAFALADAEVCQNHTQHTEDCGFAPAVKESCQHQCAEACYTYTQNCQHLNCTGCIYVPAVESYICSHTCDETVCGFVAPTQGTQCTCPADENGTVIHVENCGYVAPTQGSPCVFHGVNPACTCKAAQPEAYVCNHECSVNSGCLTPVHSCIHKEHDSTCGYVPASEGSLCTHSCELCKPSDDIPDDTITANDPAPIIYPGCEHHNHDESCGGLLNNCTYVCQTCIYEIQQMVNALPDYVTPENQSAVEAALTAIQQRYIYISTAAFQYINWTKFEYITLVLATPQNWFGFAITKRMDWVSEGLVCNFAFIDRATGAPATLVTANGAACTSFDLIPNGAGAFFYLPAGTYTIVEQVEGDWILSTTVNGAAAPGNTFTGTAGNYNIMLTNSPAPSHTSIDGAAVKFEPEDYIYDGTQHDEPDITVTLDSVPLTKDADYTVMYSREDGVDSSLMFVNAGIVKVTITGKGSYIDSKTVNFEIKQRTPDYTVPGPFEATYGNILSSIELPDGFAWENPDSLVGDAGTQTHKVTYTPSDTNYATVTGIEVTVNVAKADVTVTQPTAEPNLTYNGAEQVLAKAPDNVVVCVGEAVGDDAIWGVDARATNAGTYKVWYKSQLDEGNYNIPEPKYIEVEIAQAPITVKAEDATKVYGGEDPIFTAENISGEVFTGDELIFSFDLDPEIATEVGEYAIVPSVSEKSIGKDNYDITLEKGTFTITPAELTVIPDVTSKTYGADEPELTFDVDGFKGSESVADIEGSLTRASGRDVGEYEFDISGLDAGKNYTLKLADGAKFTITPATPTADNFTFTAPNEKIATGGTVSASVVAKDDSMGTVTIGYYNDKGDSVTPNAAGTYTVKIDVAAGKNFTAASGITADTWAFTLEADPADTDNTKKVEDITKDNVKPGDKTDLEKAKADLEKALEENKDKYTDEQKKDIQADIDRIDEALKVITPVIKQYIVTYGNHGYWYKGSYYALAFKCDGPYAKFIGITIDGRPVDRSYYAAFEGSTVVNLSPQLLNLLPVGAHSITFEYSDGYATGYFYVLKAPINAVMTGDDSDGGLMALTLSLSAMGFVLTLGALRRRKNQN